MPNDAKLGLVLGIGLVVVIGLIFFRTDPPADGAGPPPTNTVQSAPLRPQANPDADPLSN